MDERPRDKPPPAEDLSPGSSPYGVDVEIVVDTEGLVDRRADLAVALGVVLIGLVLIGGSFAIRHGTVTQDPIGVAGIPRAVGGILIVCGSILVIRRLREARSAYGNLVSSDGGSPDEKGHPISSVRPWLFVIASVAWVIALPRLGYIVATTALCAALLVSSQVQSKVKTIVIPLALAVISWYVFDRAIGINLPSGLLERWLDDVVPRLG